MFRSPSNAGLQRVHDFFSKLVEIIGRNKILFLVFGISFLVEASIKLQNSSNGLFGTQDEWTVYNRARYLLEYSRLPIYEPLELPLTPIVAPIGTTLVMAGFMEVLGTNPFLLSYSGVVLGSLVSVALFLATKTLLNNDPNKESIAIGAVVLALLSAPFVVRMQLFLGETISFLLFLFALRSYILGKYKTVVLLVLSIGFTEQFCALIAIIVFFFVGMVGFATAKSSKILKWNLAICIAAGLPSVILFLWNGTSYGTGYFTEGVFPYLNIVMNTETIFNLMGTITPFLGVTGLLFLLWKFRRSKFGIAEILLITWAATLILYSVIPPLLPGVTLFRTLDYLTMPLAILGSFFIVRVGNRSDQIPILIFTALLLFLSNLYLYYGPMPYNVLTLGLKLSEFSVESLLAMITASAMLVTVLWKSGVHTIGNSRAPLAALLLLLFLVTLVQFSYYSPYELEFYQSYFTSSQITYLEALPSTLPKNSVIATSGALAPVVAGITNKTIKDLPAFLNSSQIIFSDIENDSVSFLGTAPTPLRVPLPQSEPIYLLVLSGWATSVILTNPNVVTELMQDSHFTLTSNSGTLFLFSVSAELNET